MRSCNGCESCNPTGICAINDDFQKLLQKVKNSMGIVLSSPTYNYNVTAEMKTFLDRCYCLYEFGPDRRSWTTRLPGKRFAAVINVGEQENPELLGFALEAMVRPLEDLGYGIVDTLKAPGFYAPGEVWKQSLCSHFSWGIGKANKIILQFNAPKMDCNCSFGLKSRFTQLAETLKAKFGGSVCESTHRTQDHYVPLDLKFSAYPRNLSLGMNI